MPRPLVPLDFARDLRTDRVGRFAAWVFGGQQALLIDGGERWYCPREAVERMGRKEVRKWKREVAA